MYIDVFKGDCICVHAYMYIELYCHIHDKACIYVCMCLVTAIPVLLHFYLSDINALCESRKLYGNQQNLHNWLQQYV